MRGKKENRVICRIAGQDATHGQKGHHKTAHCSYLPVKVHIIWEGHKSFQNLHHRFDHYYKSKVVIA